jgi:hypothetical protein
MQIRVGAAKLFAVLQKSDTGLSGGQNFIGNRKDMSLDVASDSEDSGTEDRCGPVFMVGIACARNESESNCVVGQSFYRSALEAK